MNFAGYIPLNRGLIEHTMNGRLTNNEALTFVWLLMLADRRTGSYTINQPTLRFYLPGLSKGGAQDALEGLEHKRYIYRDVKPRSKVAYRYWIDGFTPTDGPHKSSRLDLSEVFATKDTSKVRYVKVPPETTPASQPRTKPAGPKSNETREEIPEKENPSDSTGECASESASIAQRVSTEGITCGEGGAPQVRTQCATTAPQLPDNCSITAPQLPPGYELRDGEEGLGVYSPSGVKVSPNVVPSLYREQLQ